MGTQKVLQIMVMKSDRRVVLFRDHEGVGFFKLFPARQGFSFAGYSIVIEMVDESTPVPKNWTENILGSIEMVEGELGEGVKLEGSPASGCPQDVPGKPDADCNPDRCRDRICKDGSELMEVKEGETCGTE